ncbi:MAG: class I SAM-dependent methyltransferase [Bacteroidales bacterium]|nr:class I SAM-dependent methyltransferase [Bacteroidales bacterium]
MYHCNTNNHFSTETVKFLESLVEKGGPEQHEYLAFTDIVNQVIDDELESFRDIIHDSLNEKTLIGHGMIKPFGYPGDFTIINNIYRQYVNPDPKYSNWDRFFQNQAGAQAVRNRKDYFINYCSNLEASDKKNIKVLILACGPATDVHEYLEKNPDSRIMFNLVDYDQDAIDFAKHQNQKFNGSIKYYRINVLRYKPSRYFDLIWSAGLFDYFKNKHFSYMIDKYYKYLNEKGELIIGNFSIDNPTKRLMEVLSEWYLNHRSKYNLLKLAVDAGIDENLVQIDMEELGVNLFLRLKHS